MSTANAITELQQWAADALNATPWMREHAITTAAENALDIEAVLDRALAEVGVAATVLTPEINFAGTDAAGNIVAEIPRLVVSVSESGINRTRPGACTAMDAALIIAAALHSNVIGFDSMVQSFDEPRQLVIVNVTFKATLQVALAPTPTKTPEIED